ncbi:uncharacterized protein LOC120291938 [Eucalyptus grandis]|uniref:uncharacterized protein LOC120291938 n=1 Tax=Eucalyptus grandis TaxID=71139 RepID=UPI00192E7A88|nr:uncharacterized protein LOC120291938 [Eucalyptus grandis]
MTGVDGANFSYVKVLSVRNKNVIVPNSTSDGCNRSIVSKELDAVPNPRLVSPNLSRSNIEDDLGEWSQFQRNEEAMVPNLTFNGCSRSNVTEELDALRNPRLVRPDLLRSNIEDDGVDGVNAKYASLYSLY